MTALSYSGGAIPRARGTPAAEVARRILLIVLFISILSSSFVFVQPAPYEGFMALLALACVMARVGFNRTVVPLAVLTLILDASGMVATTTVLDQPDVIGFFGISIYLGLTGVLFACLFSDDVLRRVAVLRAAYILSAIPAVAIGCAAWFNLLPNSEIFLLAGRVASTFKDPNVYGPFLVPPLLFAIQTLVTRGLRPLALISAIIMFAGLLFSFSRGAIGNAAFALVLMLWLLFVTAETGRSRIRIVMLSLIAILCVAAIGVALVSIEPVRELFFARANLINDYDVGPGGRFSVQELSIEMILEHPLGMGALEFARINVIPPHNIYLWITVSYGWIAGAAYCFSVLLTVVQGFRAALIRTPWQTQLCVAYASYMGLAAEGFIIDTDHWRHYYVLLGLVWGMVAATRRYVRKRAESGEMLPAGAELRPA